MNWTLILALGLTGIIPPLAGHLLGLDADTAMLASLALWTVLAAALWVPMVLRAGASAFPTLLAIGVVAGACAGIIDVAFTGDPLLLAIAVAVGAVWGALFGGVAHFLAKRRRASTP